MKKSKGDVSPGLNEKGWDMSKSIFKNFDRELLNEDRCREWFLRWLYGFSIRCPRCGYPLKEKRLPRFFEGMISYCSNCGKKWYPLKGSPFYWTKFTYQELVTTLFLWELGITPEVIATLLKRRSVAVLATIGKIEEVKRQKSTRP